MPCSIRKIKSNLRIVSVYSPQYFRSQRTLQLFRSFSIYGETRTRDWDAVAPVRVLYIIVSRAGTTRGSTAFVRGIRATASTIVIGVDNFRLRVICLQHAKELAKQESDSYLLLELAQSLYSSSFARVLEGISQLSMPKASSEIVFNSAMF